MVISVLEFDELYSYNLRIYIFLETELWRKVEALISLSAYQRQDELLKIFVIYSQSIYWIHKFFVWFSI